ncbi:MAG TPA: DoxX family protein [Solirubrobacteraceae bacterium]
MKLFRTLLRVAVGALFVGHGTQKLFGWFDGHGLKATAEGFENMGMHPGLANAIAGGVAEAGGGVLTAAGFLTPLGGAGITAAMLTAIHRVHLKNGPWATAGGYEYNLVLILTVLALVEAGPGPLSVDALKGQERKGTLWALASLAAAGAGSAGAHFAAAALAPAPPAES